MTQMQMELAFGAGARKAPRLWETTLPLEGTPGEEPFLELGLGGPWPPELRYCPRRKAVALAMYDEAGRECGAIYARGEEEERYEGRVGWGSIDMDPNAEEVVVARGILNGFCAGLIHGPVFVAPLTVPLARLHRPDNRPIFIAAWLADGGSIDRRDDPPRRWTRRDVNDISSGTAFSCFCAPRSFAGAFRAAL